MPESQIIKEEVTPPLSVLGQARIVSSVAIEQLHKNMRASYHEGNPNGVINMGVAENTLIHDELCQYFEKNFHLQSRDFTYGDGLTGTTRLCKAISNFLNSYFNPYHPVNPDHLVMGAGVIPIISQLGRVIANAGDGILLAAPYYLGFDMGLYLEHGIKPVGASVPLYDMFTLRELGHLERTLQESNFRGTTIKAVILCNPHNPLGRPYPAAVLAAYCQFCERHNLHLICDEIYAFSVFPSNDFPHPQSFTSILSLNLRSLGVNPARVHSLYGMSKDFNANGFRAGVFISQSNPLIIQSLMTGAMFMTIASPTDLLWSTLLNDSEFLPSFLKKNKLKLRAAYEYATAWLRFHNVPYFPSCAGHFLMIDVRPLLLNIDRYGSLLSITPEHDMREREAALSAFLFSNKVSVMPGSKYHNPEGGWLRLTFTIRRDFMNVALARIETALKWDRWPGLPSMEL